MKNDLATKVKQTELEKRLDSFASIEHVKKLKDYFLPKIEAFSGKIDEFQEENMKVRECCIRFDEDLSFKANKNEFLVLKGKLE
jgi:hypothetical protein